MTIQLLSGFTVRVDGAGIPGEAWRSKRVRNLIRLLALAPGHRMHRDQVIDTLWSDSDLNAAANNFHQTLFAARRVLDPASPGCLLLEEGTLSLSGNVDVDAFEAAAARAKDIQDPAMYQAALAIYKGDLLPDDRYEEWTLAQREALRQLYLRRLLDLARLYGTRQEYDQGIAALQRLLTSDRSHEEAHAGLMRLYALSGQRQLALRQYQALREALKSELDVEPGPETTRLYEDIQSGRYSTRPNSSISGSKEILHQEDLPTGTVTFLFTDIEGSTPLWEKMPEAMQTAVAQHHSILRQAIETNNGQVYQVIGDAFQSVFRLATDGLRAALDAQRALRSAQWGPTGPLRVRMGLHTGPAELDDKKDAPYQVGHTLNRAARVMSAGYGGQILLSQEAADLVIRTLPEGAALKDLGDHRLKGIATPEHLYQASGPGLADDFPPLPTSLQVPNNLPHQLTTFIGREKEIDFVQALIQEQRLVMLTGAGGTGKTRLALKSAESLLDQFRDGVFLIELAPISDPDLVAQACLQTLELIHQPGIAVQAILESYLEKKHLLLILDNCEHVITACTGLVSTLLKTCPHLHILATSREILSVPGESLFRMPSLAFPDPRSLPELGVISHHEAIRLFVERAIQVSPGFTLTEENMVAVATICQRLDGIPLAIELAAARTHFLTVDQLASRLDNTFRILTGGSKAVLPRQQTLKATIDWSYDLLTAKERLLLDRLSVFAGGWTLEAAEAVCSDEIGAEASQLSLDVNDVIDLLSQLVDKSLVIASIQNGGGRYHLLETIRQYARDRLKDTGRGVEVRNRHLAYHAHLSGEAEHNLHAKKQIEWMERLDQELDNLRAALEWSFSSRIELGLKIAADLMWFWHSRALFEEEIDWLVKLLAVEAQQRGEQPLTGDRALQLARGLRTYAYHARTGYPIKGITETESLAIHQDCVAILRALGPAYRRELGISLFYLYIWERMLDQPTPIQAEMLDIFEKEHEKFYLSEYLFYSATYLHKEPDEAIDLINLAMAICRETEDLNGIIGRSLSLGEYLMYKGDYSQAEALIKESIEISRKTKTYWVEAYSYVFLANLAMARGNYTDAVQLSSEALIKYHTSNYLAQTEGPLKTLQQTTWSQGDYEASQRYGQEMIASFPGEESCEMAAYLYLGRVAISQDDLAQAEDFMMRSIRSDFWEVNTYGWEVITPHLLGWIALFRKQKKVTAAARLIGAVDSIYRQAYGGLIPRERSEYEVDLASTRAALGKDVFATAFSAGQAITLEQAVAWVAAEMQVQNER